MTGTDETSDRPQKRSGDHHPKSPTRTPDPKNPTFDPARELGRQLAKGVAFSAGKKLADAAMSEVSDHPDDNFFTRLLDWIQSL
jgi:hypothetical protein